MATREEWRERVKAWQQSGQSAREFAEGKPYNAKSLHSRASELGLTRRRSAELPGRESGGGSMPFARVTLRRDAPRKMDIAPGEGHVGARGVVMESGGVRAFIEPGVDVTLLSLVIQALRGES